jgi:threonine dehydratase
VANAILLLLERAKTFVEGAGAAALAAVIYKKIDVTDKNVAVIISGGNLAPNLLNRIITKGLIKGGRVLKIQTKISDHPGALAKVLNILAGLKANIISIVHDRESLELSFQQTDVIIEMETRDKDHINQIITELRKNYDIEILKF